MNGTVIGAVIGAVIALIGILTGMWLQRYVIRQKAHELFLTSLEHLGGGSQARNLGISALEFYRKDYDKEKHLIIPLLVGAAIYLLTESKQGDAQHERYNLKRIMSLLLDKYKIDPTFRTSERKWTIFQRLGNSLDKFVEKLVQKYQDDGRVRGMSVDLSVPADSSEMECFLDLYKALCDWNLVTREIKKVKGETVTRGLRVEEELIDGWKGDLKKNIKNLIDDVQCYHTIRELRWPDGVACPSCESKQVIKRGFDDSEPARQCYECRDCDKRFDDLTDTIIAGHHQPLKVWILCRYFMRFNLSNEQLARELSVNESDVQQMTTELRGGMEKKAISKPIQRGGV